MGVCGCYGLLEGVLWVVGRSVVGCWKESEEGVFVVGERERGNILYIYGYFACNTSTIKKIFHKNVNERVKMKSSNTL